MFSVPHFTEFFIQYCLTFKYVEQNGARLDNENFPAHCCRSLKLCEIIILKISHNAKGKRIYYEVLRFFN